MFHNDHSHHSLSHARRRARIGAQRAWAAGLATTALALAAGLAVGEISGIKAMHLLKSMMPTVRFFVSAIMTAAATILALMLTLLSLSFNSHSRLKAAHYERIQQIAFIDCVAFVGATLFMMLLLVSVPMEQTGALPPARLDVMFQLVLAATAGLGGVLVAIVVLLFSALRDMIDALALGKRSSVLLEPEEDRS